MKPKTDPSTKPYYRCLHCSDFRNTCGGRPTRDMDLKNWCEYIRDVMDYFRLTIAYVSEKADVSQKRIELIRAIKDDQDILRATARRVEQVVLGPATNHMCTTDFNVETMNLEIEQLKAENESLRKDKERQARIIDKLLDTK